MNKKLVCHTVIDSNRGLLIEFAGTNEDSSHIASSFAGIRRKRGRRCADAFERTVVPDGYDGGYGLLQESTQQKQCPSSS